MAKQLTERQAWLKLAKLWDGAKKHEDCVWFYAKGEHGQLLNGICGSLIYLWDAQYITGEMREKMRSNVRNIGFVAECYPYKWPRDKAGARARAAFCRQQAAKLVRKKPCTP